MFFLRFFAMSPILQMMPNMTPKWCPNAPQNRPKIDKKSIRKPMQNSNASWHRFLIDFGLFWAPRRASKSIPNRLKIDLGRPWRPQGRPRPTQDPLATLPGSEHENTPSWHPSQIAAKRVSGASRTPLGAAGAAPGGPRLKKEFPQNPSCIFFKMTSTSKRPPKRPQEAPRRGPGVDCWWIFN